MQGSDKSSLSGAIEWLEDEQRQTKALAGKLQQQIEQLLSMAWEQAKRLQTAEETLSFVNSQIAHLLKLEEEARQNKESLVRLQELQALNARSLEEAEQKWQSERERERQERAELWHKMSSLEKEQEPLLTKLHGLAESDKRYKEALAELQQWHSNLEKSNQALETKTTHNLEQNKHWEQETSRLDRELEGIRKQDEILLSRMQILADQMRNISQDITAVRAEQELGRDLPQSIELQRTGQQRLERQLAVLEQLGHQQGERLDDQLEMLHQGEARERGNFDRLTDLQQQIGDLHQWIAEQFASLVQIQEQQRHRQIAELEQQIRELKLHSIKPTGD
ncbi:MAG: hypothetical protein A2Y60_04785 [Chloroflexi bacterium RBG_13_54_9]|nr:MAG: hypothetical protein A2Y60_04785 [Chloroflexi bacterium RBG_13_54_9]